jgi:hypothetical protein
MLQNVVAIKKKQALGIVAFLPEEYCWVRTLAADEV